MADFNKIADAVPVLYRYQAHTEYSWDSWGESCTTKGVRVILVKMPIRRETPRGVHVWDPHACKERWVSLHSRKAYAYATKELALNSFKIRNSRRIMYLKNALKETEMAKAALDLDDMFMKTWAFDFEENHGVAPAPSEEIA